MNSRVCVSQQPRNREKEDCMRIKVVGIGAALMLSACEATSSISYTGNTVADGTLKGDITKYVSLFFLNGVGAGCNRVNAISMKARTKE